ncbi:bifunctional hydroxymethylpyrimidine kinase/phosphomethylpyrimidine kinase [Kocuria atrinae]|uniref:bifunctional hydroxymethylpyrimidine kinase/phosphomethylpyrimidine kinase n=1 Tax=Kocuria atrinae TaxID=592377 RepID=UPI0002FECA1B|nr:bifunctional hydroxymethylpyrimidine kinase/phosphomethylpyrimidine kinase [Kocuria atrinae]
MTTAHSDSLTVPRVLSIAGTDPTGGAGQAADLKSIAAMGGYGMNVITAVVAQNTTGVIDIHTPPVEILRAQLEAVSSDVTLDAVKVGMLGSVDVIETVRDWLAEVKPPVTVVDPVMVATAGGRLLKAEAETALMSLLPLADLITPNLPELAVLADAPTATTWDEALEQGRSVAERFGARILVKGGHLPGSRTPDALLEPGRTEPVVTFDDPRVETSNTHGTGCSLSSAIATLIARTGDWAGAVGAARTWLRGALEHADSLNVGHGNGPVHHFHHVQSVLEHGESSERFTDALWRDCAGVRREINELEFIAQLADGSLPPRRSSGTWTRTCSTWTCTPVPGGVGCGGTGGDRTRVLRRGSGGGRHRGVRSSPGAAGRVRTPSAFRSDPHLHGLPVGSHGQ